VYGSRSSIWIRTLFVVVTWAAAIVLLDRELVARRIGSRALSLALAFVLVQTFAIVLMLGVLVARRAIAERRARRSHAILADANAAVSAHAAGSDQLRVLRALQAESRRDVAAAVASFLSATRGSMHDRVAVLARDLGIGEQETTAERVVDRAAAGTLYDRALLADRLQPHAARIASTEIARALAIGDEKHAIAALDLLRAWRRALPVAGLEHALTHSSEEVRSRAFAVLPYVQPLHLDALPQGLRDASPQVRIAAAHTAGKLRDAASIPALETALRDEDNDVAVAAAFALATMEEGLALLQSERVGFEAVEKAMLGRLELA
jgi:hypothetical protein